MLTEEDVLIWGTDPKKLSTGQWAVIKPFTCTVAILVGLSGWGFEQRFDYETYGEALSALLTWNGRGDPPGAWLAERAGPVHRPNPKLYALKGIAVVPPPVIPTLSPRDPLEELAVLARRSRL
jgi:hypothetical protein